MASTSTKQSSEKIPRNISIKRKLEEAGFDVFLPQEHQQETLKETLELEFKIIKKCEFLVLVLSDTRGIYLEAGFAKGIGKKVFALEVEETRKYSKWLVAFMDYITSDIDDLISVIKKTRF